MRLAFAGVYFFLLLSHLYGAALGDDSHITDVTDVKDVIESVTTSHSASESASPEPYSHTYTYNGGSLRRNSRSLSTSKDTSFWGMFDKLPWSSIFSGSKEPRQSDVDAHSHLRVGDATSSTEATEAIHTHSKENHVAGMNNVMNPETGSTTEKNTEMNPETATKTVVNPEPTLETSGSTEDHPTVMGSSEGSYRITVIGDPVDREAIKLWCTKHRGKLFTDEHRPNSTLLPAGNNLNDMLHQRRLEKRNRAWNMLICDERTNNNVVLGFIDNRFGVKPQPPWHQPMITIHGLEDVAFAPDATLQETLDLGLLPGLKFLEDTMGGMPHGVLVNSLFWDLSHPDPELISLRQADKDQFVQTHPLDHPFLTSWAGNMSSLLTYINDHNKDATSFSWHSANRFMSTNGPEHWHNDLSLHFVKPMNALGKEVATDHGYHVIDFFDPNMPLSDDLMPKPKYLIDLIDKLIIQVKSSNNAIELAHIQEVRKRYQIQ